MCILGVNAVNKYALIYSLEEKDDKDERDDKDEKDDKNEKLILLQQT